jgi:hypothetical protein
MMHKCRAVNCKSYVDYNFLMCPRHWFMVPRNIRIAVTRSWRFVVDHKRRFTVNWWTAVEDAVAFVAEREGLSYEKIPAPAGLHTEEQIVTAEAR